MTNRKKSKRKMKKQSNFNTQEERRRLNAKDGPIGRIGGLGK